jgi:hypothetical protein
MAGKRFVGRAALWSGVAIAMAGMLAAAPADAAEHGARAPRGDVTRHTEHARTQHARTQDGRTRHDEVTGPQGRSATRDATVVNDREAGTHTRDVVATGPNGRQATRHDVAQRTADGHARGSTVTLPDGRTATRDVTATHDPATGTVVKDVNVDRAPAPRPKNSSAIETPRAT